MISTLLKKKQKVVFSEASEVQNFALIRLRPYYRSAVSVDSVFSNEEAGKISFSKASEVRISTLNEC